jgi:hypothetical protein
MLRSTTKSSAVRQASMHYGTSNLKYTAMLYIIDAYIRYMKRPIVINRRAGYEQQRSQSGCRAL